MTATRDSELDEALARARPPDRPGLPLARARVAGALFGRPAAFGRFHVLDRIGHGGMGVVYAAYDPELDRGVALKMVATADHVRALAEAKALARLSHPNVVPIFDVGSVEDRVYIVMELVRGPTLRAWVKDRRPDEILDVYRQAGHAHAAGLVHRDFKPDNAIVGTDGRVRVVDFGLACETVADAGRAGTPGYMAPEPEVTPAADQYSFCVSLGEALGAAAPAWVKAIVERGTSPSPTARFPAMTELLRALGRDPARVWRRRVFAAGAAGVAIAAFFAGRSGGDEAPASCAGGAAEIAASWDPASRDAQLARIATLSPYGGELAPRIAVRIRDHAERWAANHRDACTLHLHGLQSPAMFDRRMICLERGRAAVSALGKVAESADANALPGLARATASLPDPDACADVIALASDVPPPPPAIAPRLAQLRAALETSRVQLRAGHASAAQTTAHAAATELRPLDYAPLLAEALLVEGEAVMATDEEAALPLFGEATRLAIGARLDAIAVEAWARRAWIEGDRDPIGALGGFDVIDVLGRRSGSAASRALLYNNVGSVELGRPSGQPQALAAFRDALALARDVRGIHTVELTAIRRNLAQLVTDDVEREQLLREARDELATLLGDGNPETINARFRHVISGVLSLAETARALPAICDQLAGTERYAALEPDCLGELADRSYELGDRDRAGRAYLRAFVLAALGHKQPSHPETAGYLALLAGEPAQAARLFEAALAAYPLPSTRTHVLYSHGKLRLGQGRALRALGKRREARLVLEQALATFDALASPQLLVRRSHNAVRAELARLGAPRDLALAIAWYRAVGLDDRSAELSRITARPTGTAPP